MMPPTPCSVLPAFSELPPAAQAAWLLADWQQSHPLAPIPTALQQAQMTAFCSAVLALPRSDINVDEQDVRSTLRGALAFELVSASAAGALRAGQAARQLLASMRLPLPLQPHGRALLAISSPSITELQLDELTEIVETLQQQLGPDTELIFGHGVAPTATSGALTLWLLAAAHGVPLPSAPAGLIRSATPKPPSPGPDAALAEAAHLALRHGYGSIPLLQRQLGTGYNRTGRLLGQLQLAGVISNTPTPGTRHYPTTVANEAYLTQLLSGLSC